MRISDTIKVNLALFTAVSTWALAFVAIRIGLEGYSPGALALLRFSVSSCCLGAFFGRNQISTRFSLRHLGLIICISLCGIFGYSLLLNTGQKTISSGLASFIVAQTPVITTTLAIAIFSERPTLITVIGITISGLGIATIVGSQPFAFDFNLGLLMVMAATLLGSCHTILQKYLLQELSPYHVTTFATWFGTICLLIFLPQLINEAAHAPSTSTIAAIFLGIVPSACGQWLWTYGLSKTMVVRASAYLYTMPIISTLFGWLLLSEIPSMLALIGGLIALIGSMLVKKDISPKKTLPKGYADKEPTTTSA